MFEMMFATCVLFAILVFGDVISLLSKARIPMMFVALITYMVLVWMGMPKDYAVISGLGTFGALMIPPIIIHMATLISPKEYIQHWKAVVVALVSVAAAMLLVIVVGGLIFGQVKMLSGAGAVCGGGIISAIAAAEKLQTLGLTGVAVIPMVMIGLIDPVGQPIAANILRKYAVELKRNSNFAEATTRESETVIASLDEIPYGTDENPSPRFKALIPRKFETEFIMLFKLFLLGLVGVTLEKYTGINMILWCLILGILASYFGLLRGKMLERANSFAIALAALLCYAFSMMNDVTAQMLLQEIVTVVAILVLGVIGLTIGGAAAGRIVGWPAKLGAAVGVGVMFGFPGNLIVSTEVSRSIGETEEEKDYLFSKISPPMLVGGISGFFICVGITVSLLLKLIH